VDEPISQANLDFFQEVMPIIVGTRRQNGVVKMDPAWYEFRDGHFWLNSFRGSRWLANIERDGQASLLLIDPKDMTRVVHVEAGLVGVSTDGAEEHLAGLTIRYGMPMHADPEPQVRIRIQLEPRNVRSTLDWMAQMAAIECAASMDLSDDRSGAPSAAG
jgi:hypothetical protein